MNYQFNHRVINIPQTYEHNIDRWRNSIKNSIHNLLDRCSFDCKNSFNCSKAYNFSILTALFYGHIFCTCIHLNLCTCSDARKLYKNGMFFFYFGAVNRDNDGFDSTHRIYDANADVVVFGRIHLCIQRSSTFVFWLVMTINVTEYSTIYYKDERKSKENAIHSKLYDWMLIVDKIGAW